MGRRFRYLAARILDTILIAKHAKHVRKERVLKEHLHVLGARGSDAELHLSHADVHQLGIDASWQARNLTDQITAYAVYAESDAHDMEINKSGFHFDAGEDARVMREALFLAVEHPEGVKKFCATLRARLDSAASSYLHHATRRVYI